MTNPKNAPGAKVTFVTFPRSGHHLLERGMRAALGPRFVYQNQADPRFDYSSRWWMQASKTHDYGLDFKPKNELVVVQDREFEPAYESWCEYELARRQKPPPRDMWRAYFDRFMRRWITGHHLEDGVMYGCQIIRIPYLYLCESPIEAVQRILVELNIAEEITNKADLGTWAAGVRVPREGLSAVQFAEPTVEQDIDSLAARMGADPAEVSQDDPLEEPPVDEEPTEPSEPHQPSCDPSSGETKPRGLGMGTTEEL